MQAAAGRALTAAEIRKIEDRLSAGVERGKPNKPIAFEPGCAERTIKAHRARLMEKMHCRSVAELVHVTEQLQRMPQPA